MNSLLVWVFVIASFLFKQYFLSHALLKAVLAHWNRPDKWGVIIFNIIQNSIVAPTTAYQPGSKSSKSPVKNGKLGTLFLTEGIAILTISNIIP
jgi:hypothetical protein